MLYLWVIKTKAITVNGFGSNLLQTKKNYMIISYAIYVFYVFLCVCRYCHAFAGKKRNLNLKQIKK